MCQTRTKFHFVKQDHDASVTPFVFEALMPGRVQENDLLDANKLVPEDQVPAEFEGLIYGLSFHVEYVNWSRDEQGIFLTAWCIGD